MQIYGMIIYSSWMQLFLTELLYSYSNHGIVKITQDSKNIVPHIDLWIWKWFLICSSIVHHFVSILLF